MERLASVGIFWDLENCPPPANSSGYDITASIRTIAEQYGVVECFRAYMEVKDSVAKSNSRSELQSSGVSIIDCPHNGSKDVVDKMLIVDSLVYALSAPTSTVTVVLISGDRDYAYLVSTLRLRRHNIVLIVPNVSVHRSLTAQASEVFRWESVVGGRHTVLHASTSTKPARSTDLSISSIDLLDDDNPQSLGLGSYDTLPFSSRRDSYRPPSAARLDDSEDFQLVPDLLGGNADEPPVAIYETGLVSSPTGNSWGNWGTTHVDAIEREFTDGTCWEASVPLPETPSTDNTEVLDLISQSPAILPDPPKPSHDSPVPLQDSPVPLPQLSIPVPAPPPSVLNHAVLLPKHHNSLPHVASIPVAAPSLPTQNQTALLPKLPNHLSHNPFQGTRAIQPQKPPQIKSNFQFTLSPAHEKFRPLVDLLRAKREQGVDRPFRAAIAETLVKQRPNIYKNTDTKSWTTYAADAERLGIVTLSGPGTGGRDWISLNVQPALAPAFVPQSHFKPLINVLERLRSEGCVEVEGSNVRDKVVKLHPTIFTTSGCTTWKQYIMAAETKGLVKTTLRGSAHCISLARSAIQQGKQRAV